MKLAAGIVAAAVLAAPQAAAKGPTAPRAVFGIEWQGRDTWVRELNALTLRPMSKRAPLGTAGSYLGRSPGNGMRAAFTIGESGNAIRFVDLTSMKSERPVALPCPIGGATVWEDASRLVTTCGGAAASVLVVDPVRHRVRSRKALRGSLGSVRAANGLLAGVLEPLDRIGAARLVVVDDTGRVRTVALPGIRAGQEVIDSSSSSFRVQAPGLALDPSGRRAAVVPASGAIEVVDLATLAVTSHPLPERTIAAARKNIEGWERTAVWTSSNTIAVSGRDWTADGQPDHATPAGLTLIDADDWSSRTLDRAAVDVTYTGWTLLSSSTLWDTKKQRPVGNGITGYDAGGARRFHVFGTEAVWMAAVAGTFGYVADDTLTRFRIFDTTTGSMVNNARTARPTTLAAMRSTF